MSERKLAYTILLLSEKEFFCPLCTDNCLIQSYQIFCVLSERRIWFSLIWFYGISTIVGYLMPNPVLTYIVNIQFVKTFYRYHHHHHHHYHHIVPSAQISLTLSRHFSLSLIASGRSSGLHPVSSHSFCM